MLDRSDWEGTHRSIGYRSPLLHDTTLVVVFVPNETFLPFSIPVINHLHRRYNSSFIVAYGAWSPGFDGVQYLTDAPVVCMGTSTLTALLPQLKCKVKAYITHPYGWVTQDNTMIAAAEPGNLYYYADGFSNRVHNNSGHRMRCNGVFFFGHKYKENKLPVAHVFGYDEVIGPLLRLARMYGIPFRSAESKPIGRSYAMVYMRYWGRESYCFSVAQAVQVMFDTIRENAEPDIRLVVKNDPRVVPEVYEGLIARLRSHGYSITLVDDFLASQGLPPELCMFPVEYLWAHGWLCDASVHFVFDSTVGFTLVNFPGIATPYRLVVGGALDSITRGAGKYQPKGTDHLELELGYLDPKHPRDVLDAVQRIEFNVASFSESLRKRLSDMGCRFSVIEQGPGCVSFDVFRRPSQHRHKPVETEKDRAPLLSPQGGQYYLLQTVIEDLWTKSQKESREEQRLVGLLETNLQTLAAEKNSVKSRCEQLESSLKEGEEQRQQLESSLKEGEQQRQQLESSLKEGEQQRQQLESSLKEGEEQRQQLESSLKEGEEQRQQLESSLKEGEQQRQQLESSLKEGEQQRQQLESSLKEGEQQRQQLESSLKEGEQQRQQLESSLKEGEQQRQQLESSLNATIVDLKQSILEWQSVAGRRDAELGSVYHSRSWRLVLLLRKVEGKVIPRGSLRRRVARLAWKGVRPIVRTSWSVAKGCWRLAQRVRGASRRQTSAGSLGEDARDHLPPERKRQPSGKKRSGSEETVSVIIPTFNGSRTVTRAIDSVFQQDYARVEVIVVDDGSSDSTVEVVRAHAPSARIIQQQNQGTMSARQTGIAAAEGDLIALLDQDDQWYPDSLRVELSILEEHPETGLVIANMDAVDESGMRLGFKVVPDSHCHTPSWEELLLIWPIATSTVLFRKGLVGGIGGLDCSFGFSGALGDLDTLLRIREITEIRFLDKCLGSYCWSEMRPGRLISFLDNLEVYAKKHWRHPRLRQKNADDLRARFMSSCCGYASHIYRLLLTQHNGEVSNELLCKLNDHHRFAQDLFRVLYASNDGLQPLEPSTLDLASGDTRTLLFLYLLRLDLQKAFPQAAGGDLRGLVRWGSEVASGRINDGDAAVLRPLAGKLNNAAMGADQSPVAAASGSDGANRGEAGNRRSHTPRSFASNLAGRRAYGGLRAFVNRLLPVDTKRRRLSSPLVKAAKVLLGEGAGVLCKKFIRRLGRSIRSVLQSQQAGHGVVGSGRNADNASATVVDLARGFQFSVPDGDGKVVFPQIREPEAAVILEFSGDPRSLHQCARSLIDHMGMAYRVIVVPRNPAVKGMRSFGALENATVVSAHGRVGSKAGLYDSLRGRLGAEKYILFLSDDVLIAGGELAQMATAMEAEEGCGAVGCKTLDPAGKLREAGWITLEDGRCIPYGLGDDQGKPEYSYVRRVQRCSDRCLLVRRAALDDVSLPPSAKRPGEDICDLIRSKGYGIAYQPAVVVVSRHDPQPILVGGQTPHRPTGVESGVELLRARGRESRAAILVMDDYIPAIRYGSGFPRLYEMLSCLAELGYGVTFLPVGNPVAVQPETSELQQKGVEIFWENHANLQQVAEQRAGYYDLVLISRPHVFARIHATAREFFPEAGLLYDAEALFCMREVLKMELGGNTVAKKKQLQMIRAEMELVEAADLVISVSQDTKRKMHEYSSQRNIEVWEHVQDTEESAALFTERHGIVFMGSFFAGPGSPNEDAALYFANEVFPLVRSAMECRLHIVGTSPTPAVASLASADVEVVGYVDELREYFRGRRVNVVPTRFAAGIPLKLIEVMSYGVPSVVTSLIADQLGVSDGKEVLVADNPHDFAERVIRLYSDETLWLTTREHSIDFVKTRFSKIAMRNKLDGIVQAGLHIREEKRIRRTPAP